LAGSGTRKCELLHADVLNPELLTKQMGLLPQALTLGLSPKLMVHALRGPALRQCQGGPGQADDLDNRRADSTGASLRAMEEEKKQ
jgi:hypothetical protein